MNRRTFLAAMAAAPIVASVAPTTNPIWTPPFGIDYAPSPGQLAFHMGRNKSKFAWGGLGCGKTTALLVEVAKRIEESGRTCSVAFIARDWTRCVIFMNAWARMFGRVEVKPLLTFVADGSDLRGHQYDLVACDEISPLATLSKCRVGSVLIASTPVNAHERDLIVNRYMMSLHRIGTVLDNTGLRKHLSLNLEVLYKGGRGGQFMKYVKDPHRYGSTIKPNGEIARITHEETVELTEFDVLRHAVLQRRMGMKAWLKWQKPEEA